MGLMVNVVRDIFDYVTADLALPVSILALVVSLPSMWYTRMQGKASKEATRIAKDSLDNQLSQQEEAHNASLPAALSFWFSHDPIFVSLSMPAMGSRSDDARPRHETEELSGHILVKNHGPHAAFDLRVDAIRTSRSTLRFQTAGDELIPRTVYLGQTVSWAVTFDPPNASVPIVLIKWVDGLGPHAKELAYAELNTASSGAD
jgi:hypothetical protein